ncbi:MAG: queuosine salvage family protein [bacterium]|nr:queuosine salvage family protein [bacterium]
MINDLEYVNKNSDYVSININNINLFVDSVSDWKYKYWMNDLKEFLNEKECIIFAFICQTINFCFWGKENNDDYNYKKYIGSEELFYNLKQYVKNNPSILEMKKLINISIEDFKKIIGLEFSNLPLLQERFNLLKDTILIIYDKKDNFYTELFSIKSDVELLSYITKNFWHFDDKSKYKNRIIKFNKRAILLVNDLFQLSNTIRNNIKTLDNLTGCADYAVPRILYEYGILIYNDYLLETINSNKIIEHNSYPEIEIRANTLYVIEIIKEKLKAKGIYLNSIEIDNIIWNMRVLKKHSVPVHKTITIYY